MPSKCLQKNIGQSIENNYIFEIFLFLENLKNRIWLWGIPFWLFAVIDRGVAVFAESSLSTTAVIQFLTTCFFFASWLFLKPDYSLSTDEASSVSSHESDLTYYSNEAYICIAEDRMFDLQEQHMISQAYILPFPYVCQIYHLLNLKHLETIHSFSLNRLRVIAVSHFQATLYGGMLKFQTMLAHSANFLRIWRQPMVEVQLILHTPFTVELSLPVYNEKKIIVIFNVLPLSTNKHKFFIDIYSDLKWPKPILQLLFHCAACLTLYEDLSYLRILSQNKAEYFANLNSVSKHETMWLFRRFVELYGSNILPGDELSIAQKSLEA